VRLVKPKADNIWQVGSGYYIWYQSLVHWLSGRSDGVVELLKRGELSYPILVGEGLVADLIKSYGY
jgi:hypothetical protein